MNIVGKCFFLLFIYCMNILCNYIQILSIIHIQCTLDIRYCVYLKGLRIAKMKIYIFQLPLNIIKCNQSQCPRKRRRKKKKKLSYFLDRFLGQFLTFLFSFINFHLWARGCSEYGSFFLISVCAPDRQRSPTHLAVFIKSHFKEQTIFDEHPVVNISIFVL